MSKQFEGVPGREGAAFGEGKEVDYEDLGRVLGEFDAAVPRTALEKSFGFCIRAQGPPVGVGIVVECAVRRCRADLCPGSRELAGQDIYTSP